MDLSEFEGLRFHRVSSSRAVPGTNLTGTWKFQIGTASNTYIKSLRESVFTLKGVLPAAFITPVGNEVGPAADTIALNQGFSQNPVGCIFSSANMSINGQELPAITDWKCYTAINKALDSSMEEELNGNNPMILTDGRFEDTTNPRGEACVLPYATAAAAVISMVGAANRATHKLNSQVLHGVNAWTTTRQTIAIGTVFSMGFKFPFMDMLESEDEFIGPNTHISITFQVSPTFLTDFFHGPAAPANVNINEFQWCIPVYTGDPLMGVSLTRRFVEIETQRFSYNGTYYQVIAPSNLYRVAISPMRRSAANSQSAVPYKIATAAGPPTNTEWVSLYIQYGGKTYPEQMYRLGTSSENDWLQAWKDYQTFTLAYQSGELPAIKDFNTFLLHPVFVFQVRQPAGSVVSTPLNIHADFGATQDNLDLCVYMESVSSVAMSYDDNGAIMETVYEKIG